MGSSMEDPNRSPDRPGTTSPQQPDLSKGWRARYEGSFAQELVTGLGAVNFGDRIIIFGACLLVSVLPLIIVLSAIAGHRVQDDIAQHLGLSAQGDRVVEGLFKASVKSFDLAIILSLLLSFAGTVAVARSVEVIYERAFGFSPLGPRQGLLRCLVWVLFVSGVVIADTAIGKTLRDEPAGPAVISLVEFVGFAFFFWWSIHFLLGGRESWRGVFPAAISTALFWVGLGGFAAFYFSSTIVSDSKTYGTIGVTFTLVTWFIAMGAVLTLGAVVGAVWQRRRCATANPEHGDTERLSQGFSGEPRSESRAPNVPYAEGT
jgi:membrane protein